MRVEIQKIALYVLSILAVVLGLLGYTYNMEYRYPEVPVGFPVETALHGCGYPIAPAWHYAATPQLIRNKAEIYPEAAEFSAGYFKYGLTNQDMDITADVVEGEVPLLLQWDKRWGYELYGTNYMGNNACGPTALAIVYAGLTGKTDQTPYDIAQYAVGQGMYVSGQGTRWELMEVGGTHLGLRVQRLWKDENAIKAGLLDGKLMIVYVRKGDFTVGGHFIVIAGTTDDNKLIVRDPNSRENSAVTWDFDRVMEQSGCWWQFNL